MHFVTLAQTTLAVSNFRLAALWAELDRAITCLHGMIVTHHDGSRSYILPHLEMQMRLAAGTVTVSWLAPSPALDARCRTELRQSADAWLGALATLTLRPSSVFARVQAASALLAAGFDSVTVSSHGGIAIPSTADSLQEMAA